MVELEKPGFDTAAFLASAGLGRRIIQLAPQDAFFSQGDPADSVFYLQEGRAKVTVVSAAGKEATISLLAAGDFVGEEALAAMAGLRLATATAITACTALRISRAAMISQETLAEMIGTTRSRVSFFMNRFRKLGFIEYNGRIKVHKSLQNVVLLDQMPERNPDRPIGSPSPRSTLRTADPLL